MNMSLPSRRAFLRQTGALALALPALRVHGAALAATRRVSTDSLEFAYATAGPEDGRPVVLAHDFGYGIESFASVAPLLAAAGVRVLAPQLRGHGATRFIEATTPRSGRAAALGQDLIDFIDALHIPEAVFAGFGWGAHAAWAASVVRPTRCVGLLLAGAGRIDEAGPRERYLYASTAGRRALATAPRTLAREDWRRLSPRAPFDSALFAQVAPGFDNPDYAHVLAHAWLSRHAPDDPDAAPEPRHAALERKFIQPAAKPIAAITLDGGASGAPSAPRNAVTGPRVHRVLPGVGHHLPHEAPRAFADAAIALVHHGKWRT
ncbi:MAG: alpha/beta hydrolase [Lysobacteraceae bacterium]|nr:MAG: alpha/beta hydrolase [Xanthomonadaceae bacterium]